LEIRSLLDWYLILFCRYSFHFHWFLMNIHFGFSIVQYINILNCTFCIPSFFLFQDCEDVILTFTLSMPDVFFLYWYVQYIWNWYLGRCHILFCVTQDKANSMSKSGCLLDSSQICNFSFELYMLLKFCSFPLLPRPSPSPSFILHPDVSIILGSLKNVCFFFPL
jgi:hypothetical protein